MSALWRKTPSILKLSFIFMAKNSHPNTCMRRTTKRQQLPPPPFFSVEHEIRTETDLYKVFYYQSRWQKQINFPQGLPLGLSWKRICWECRRPRFDPWIGKTHWRRERLPTPVFWPGEFHGLYSPWGSKKSETEQLSLSISFGKQTKHKY